MSTPRAASFTCVLLLLGSIKNSFSMWTQTTEQLFYYLCSCNILGDAGVIRQLNVHSYSVCFPLSLPPLHMAPGAGNPSYTTGWRTWVSYLLKHSILTEFSERERALWWTTLPFIFPTPRAEQISSKALWNALSHKVQWGEGTQQKWGLHSNGRGREQHIPIRQASPLWKHNMERPVIKVTEVPLLPCYYNAGWALNIYGKFQCIQVIHGKQRSACTSTIK